jgi:hypothetical protein
VSRFLPATAPLEVTNRNGGMAMSRMKAVTSFVVTVLVLAFLFGVVLCWGISVPMAKASDDDPVQIKFVDDQIAFEFAGQVANFPPTPSAPLGSSNQYGYLTVVRGIDNVFSGNPHNETTAVLTFFNEVTTTESISDGPLRIIDRDGTTTIYLNNAPASFTNPDSFRSGIPVQTSTLHQQAIVDTAGGTFTAVFANTITSTTSFTISGTTFRLGQIGQAFHATVTGQLNAAPPPTGHFAGYAVGARKE